MRTRIDSRWMKVKAKVIFWIFVVIANFVLDADEISPFQEV